MSTSRRPIDKSAGTSFLISGILIIIAGLAEVEFAAWLRNATQSFINILESIIDFLLFCRLVAFSRASRKP